MISERGPRLVDRMIQRTLHEIGHRTSIILHLIIRGNALLLGHSIAYLPSASLVDFGHMARSDNRSRAPRVGGVVARLRLTPAPRPAFRHLSHLLFEVVKLKFLST